MFRLKWMLVVIIFTTSSINAEAWSQSERITLKARETNLIELFGQLQKQTSLRFVFNQEDVEKYSVDIDARNKTLEEVLDLTLADKPLSYKIADDYVIIFQRELPITQVQNLRTITGVVVDERGLPMSGVTILVKGTTYATSADKEGRYTLKIPESETPVVLIFSFVGHESREVVAGDDREKRVVMKEMHTALDDVVVTGIATMNIRENASAVSSIKAEEVMMAGYSTIDQMLQGRIAGMTVMNTSGEPSATPRIRVRGNSTIHGNKSPVWVVDGVILEQNVSFSAADINSEDAAYLIGNAIAGINPQDIETITVLKDASATAIYGVRAANGVIVLTTKRGATGTAQLRYSGSVTFDTRPSYQYYDRMNSKERIEFSKEQIEAGLRYRRQPFGDSYEGQYQRFLNKEITASEFESIINTLQARNTDWFDLIFETTVSHNHTVNLTGGSDRASYYFSVGYNNTLGGAIESDSERFNMLAKGHFELNPWLNMELKTDFSSTVNNGYPGYLNPFNYAYNTSRTLNDYNEDGSYSMYMADNGYLYNFMKEMHETGKRSKSETFNGLLSLRAKLLRGLSYQGVFSLSIGNTEQREWATEYSAHVTAIRSYEHGVHDETTDYYSSSVLPYGGILTMDNTRRTSYVVRNSLEYKDFFEDGKHSVHAMGGVEVSSNKYTGHSVTGYGWNPNYGEVFMPVYTNRFISDYVTQGKLNPVNTNNVRQIASFFGTAAYTYLGRYVLNGNIRSDGSNKFGSDPKYRWLPTWSVAGKWNISSENFMQNVPWVESLALRGSYGIQGNIHDDATSNLITKYNKRNDKNGLESHTIVRIPNPSLRWEKTRSWNVALDFTLWGGRINGGVDVYRKNTSDLITTKQVPTSTGRTTLMINSAEMRNAGFEGFVNVDILRGKTFDWRLGFNFGRNVNEVTLSNSDIYSETELVNQMLEGEIALEGDAIGSMYSYRYSRLSDQNGYALFYSKEGKEVHYGYPTYMELVNSGSVYPDLTGGIDMQFTYRKALSLELFFTYSLGNVKRLPSMYEEDYYAFNPLQNASTKLQKRWKNPGDELHTNVPALYNSDDASALVNEGLVARPEGGTGYLRPTVMYELSDVRVAKGDFLKLKSATVAYRMPRELTQKLSIASLTARFQATNLFTIAHKKWEGLDPESYGANIPVLPKYTVSLDFTF